MQDAAYQIGIVLPNSGRLTPMMPDFVSVVMQSKLLLTTCVLRMQSLQYVCFWVVDQSSHSTPEVPSQD